MVVRTIQKYHLAYALIPYKRNQDYITVLSPRGPLKFAVSVVDGWNWKEKLADDEQGRKVARFVATVYPRTFLKYVPRNTYEKAARQAAEDVDKRILQKWPRYVSAVAAFLLSFDDHDVIVFLGKGVALVHDGRTWKTPKEIGDYSLDETPFRFPNDVSRFFGRGELKGDPLYSCQPDVVVIPPRSTVFLATDGLEDVMTVKDLNAFTEKLKNKTPSFFIKELIREIRMKKTQKDDISIFIRSVAL